MMWCNESTYSYIILTYSSRNCQKPSKSPTVQIFNPALQVGTIWITSADAAIFLKNTFDPLRKRKFLQMVKKEKRNNCLNV